MAAAITVIAPPGSTRGSPFQVYPLSTPPGCTLLQAITSASLLGSRSLLYCAALSTPWASFVPFCRALIASWGFPWSSSCWLSYRALASLSCCLFWSAFLLRLLIVSSSASCVIPISCTPSQVKNCFTSRALSRGSRLLPRVTISSSRLSLWLGSRSVSA